MTKKFFNPLRFLVAVTVTAQLFTSCQKDSGGGDDASFFIKAKVDSTEVQFSGFTNATFTTLPGTSFNLCVIQGQQALNSPVNILSAVITDDSPIAINKEYSDDIVGGTEQRIVSYYDNNNNQFSSGFAISPDVKITLTEITDTYVAGIFSGKATSIGSQTVALTEGSFKVKRN